MMTVRGHFAEVSVTGTFTPITRGVGDRGDHPNGEHPHSQRAARQRSAVLEFLEIDKYPTMTFKSTKIEHVGGDRYTMTGDLTIKGVTQPVTLNMVRYGEFNDPMMGHRIGYSGETKINRKDFGMTFNPVLDGRFVVSDEILMLEGELVEKKPE